jgi:hypothetical protein
MSERKRRLPGDETGGELHDVQIGVARSGGGNPDEHLSWAGVGDRHVVQHGRLLPLEELISRISTPS